MSRLRFCLLLAVLGSCSELSHGDTVTTQKTIIIPLDTKATTTTTPPPDTTTTTTPPPDTTTTTTTTTTTSPPDTTTKSTTTTTTPPPDTTTKSTTTTSPPPDTTTTTTVAPPTPTPLPPPTQGNWSYTDSQNKTCIVVQFAAQLNVTYSKNVVNSSEEVNLWSVLINVPTDKSVSVNGSCAGDQWLELSWLTGVNSTVPNTLTLVYHNNGTTKNYGLKTLNVSLAPDNFVNRSSAEPIVLWHGPEWQTPVATSYRCRTPTQMNLTSDSSNNVVATLTLSRLQEQAYRTEPGTAFSAARECSGGDVPDAVPIAVGCALGGLVVVVLIAYLVGRRRSAARGYLSM